MSILDLNGDGYIDPGVSDSNGDGVGDVNLLDANGDGVGETWLLDGDQDQLANAVAYDTNGDGLADTFDVDVNQDGVVEARFLDNNGDQVPDTPTGRPNVLIGPDGSITMQPEPHPDLGPGDAGAFLTEQYLGFPPGGPFPGGGSAGQGSIPPGVSMGEIGNNLGDITTIWAS
jgi:hypothetical protein